MYRLANPATSGYVSSSHSPSSPDKGSNSRTTEAGDSDSSTGDLSYASSQSAGHFASPIWSSATLAFHPTGSASSCGSLFNGSAGGGHHHYQSSCDLRGASNAMAYLKSNPYAMAGITTPDLLHAGYPGESLLLIPDPLSPTPASLSPS